MKQNSKAGENPREQLSKGKVLSSSYGCEFSKASAEKQSLEKEKEGGARG